MSHTNWALVLAACGTDVSHDALYLCLEGGGGGKSILCVRRRQCRTLAGLWCLLPMYRYVSYDALCVCWSGGRGCLYYVFEGDSVLHWLGYGAG